LTDNIRGALWIVLSAFTATGMTVSVKALSGTIPSMETAFGRSLIGFIIVLPFLLTRRPLRFTSRRWPLHLLRGVLGVVAINCGFYTLTQLPIATVTALFFTAPLFVTLLAPVLLKETVGWRRWTATGVGFLGTIVVLNPGGHAFNPVMLLAVASSSMFALSLILGKKLSVTEPPSTMLFYVGGIMSLGCLPPAAWVWTPPTTTEWLILGLVGVFGVMRSYFDIRGYAIGEASAVAPFQYIRLIFIGIAGYLLFNETITASTLLGAGIIFASTFYIARREAALNKTDLTAAEEPSSAAPAP